MAQDPTDEEARQLRIKRGRAIRELRLERGIRRTELAGEVGCHPRHLDNVERGTYGASEILLRRIARALDIPVDDLREPNGAAA